MSSKGKWWQESWNPTIGCTPVSPACKNCYACEIHTMRHKAYLAGKKLPKQYAKPFNEIQLLYDRLDKPLHWREPRIIFVDSMSDLFHESVPFKFIDEAMTVISIYPQQHTFLVLTKRPARMAEYFKQLYVGLTCFHRGEEFQWPFKNLWLGVTVELPKYEQRIVDLLQIPAAHRFLSLEPLLSPIDLLKYMKNKMGDSSAFRDYSVCGERNSSEEMLESSSLNLVIVGAETGPKARYCPIENVIDVVGQCKAAGVSCFVKAVHLGTPEKFKISKDMSEWPENVRYRDLPF